jgi:histidinol dehydrogenase
MKTLTFSAPAFFEKLGRLVRENDTSLNVREGVRNILQDIRERGDRAAAAHVQRLDGVELAPEQFRIPVETFQDAAMKLHAKDRDAIEEAMRQVKDFHARRLPQNWESTNAHGARVGERFYPINRVGLYIPGGHVPLVSTVVMTATLAQLAGVPSIAAFTPPGPQGRVNLKLLAALYICGVSEVYRLGGAVAIGAAAYGTATIPRVDKIFGPGNVWTNEAKRQVVGQVGIDILAGPSEVMIIADEQANPQFIAADLIAQAEHDPRARIFVSLPNASMATTLKAALKAQTAERNHSKTIRTVMTNGFVIIVAKGMSEAAATANFLAPEHLELQVAPENQDYLLEHVTTAGAIFVGNDTPTVLGDFVAGPNHTLPTNRSARYSSGIQITDFFRRSSIVHYTREQLAAAAPAVRAFARMERLDGHGESLEIRLREANPGD